MRIARGHRWPVRTVVITPPPTWRPAVDLWTGLAAAGRARGPPSDTCSATTDVHHWTGPRVQGFCVALPGRAGVTAITVRVFYR